MSSLDLSTTKNTNVWREALNRDFKNRAENKNIPLSIEDVNQRARALCQGKLNKNEINERRSNLENSNDFQSLYFGLSHEGSGRAAYLKIRNSKSPREKNGEKSITSSQEIGHAPEIKNPKLPLHGLKGYIRKDFYSTKGVFP